MSANVGSPSRAGAGDEAPGLLGSSPAMVALRALVDVAAGGSAPVLIHGETGAGKGLVARQIHKASRGRAAPFVTVLCPALPREPTDLGRLFSQARGGTLFFDEIADMPLPDQDALLDRLRAKGAPDAAVAVRCLVTTHADLDALMRRGLFRAELYVRLSGLRLEVPPLRARLGDLPELVRAFIERTAASGHAPGSARRTLTPEALRELASHDWPGNVLELENVLERVLVIAASETIGADAVRAALDRPGASLRD